MASTDARPAPARWDELAWPGVWAPLAAFALYFVATLFIVMVVLGTQAGPTGQLSGMPSLGAQAWVTLASLVILGGVSLGMVAHHRGQGFRRVVSLGIKLRRADFVPVLVLLVLVIPTGLAIAYFLSLHQVNLDPETGRFLTHPAGLVAALVGAPVAEELWGRGLLYGALRRWGPWVAIVVTAFVSAAVHLQLAQSLSVFPGMLALSWLRYRTGRLAPCVVLHGLNNLWAVAVSFLGG
jgi:membrane protease YdiL (CAAX protease family)